jgi:hypothetical protein
MVSHRHSEMKSNDSNRRKSIIFGCPEKVFISIVLLPSLALGLMGVVLHRRLINPAEGAVEADAITTDLFIVAAIPIHSLDAGEVLLADATDMLHL